MLQDVELVRTLAAEQTDLADAYAAIVNREQAAEKVATLSVELADLEAGPRSLVASCGVNAGGVQSVADKRMLQTGGLTPSREDQSRMVASHGG